MVLCFAWFRSDIPLKLWHTSTRNRNWYARKPLTCSRSAAYLVREKVNTLVCPRVEAGFVFAVANAYEHWYDVPDSEVLEILKEFR